MVGASNSGHHVDVVLQAVLETVDEHRRLDGVPAQLEEVVLDTDLLPRATGPATVPPGIAPKPFGAIDRLLVRGSPVGGAGRALRSSLPAGVRGNAGKGTKADGTMYCGRRAWR